MSRRGALLLSLVEPVLSEIAGTKKRGMTAHGPVLLHKVKHFIHNK
jgi:hypothetical protein